MPASVLYCLLLIACVVLPGCSANAPAASSLEPNALMQLIAPGWQAEDGKDAVTLTLPADNKHGNAALASTASAAAAAAAATSAAATVTERRFGLRPVEVVQLSSQRAVLLTSGNALGDSGLTTANHASPSLLSAFWFRRHGKTWLADGRQDVVDWQGFSGGLGQTGVVEVASGQYVLSVESGSCWQGECGSWLMLYELGTHKVRPLLDETIPLAADNSGALPVDCEALYRQATTPLPAPASTNEDPDRRDCMSVAGQWQIGKGNSAPGKLSIDFTVRWEQHVLAATPTAGLSRVAKAGTASGAATRMQRVSTFRNKHARVVYQYQHGIYRLESGINPVPGF